MDEFVSCVGIGRRIINFLGEKSLEIIRVRCLFFDQIALIGQQKCKFVAVYSFSQSLFIHLLIPCL